MSFVFTHLTNIKNFEKILRTKNSNGILSMKSSKLTGVRNFGGFDDRVFLSVINSFNIETIENYENEDFYSEIFEDKDSIMIIFANSIFDSMDTPLIADDWHSPLEQHIPLTIDILKNTNNECHQIIVKDEMKFECNDVLFIVYSHLFFNMENKEKLEEYGFDCMSYIEMIDFLKNEHFPDTEN